MLNLSQPKRSPILLNCVFLLDGGIVLRRFVAFRASTATRRAETYRQNLLHPTSQSPPIPHRQGRSRRCSAHRIGRLRRRRS
jgi:hypothetical protein